MSREKATITNTMIALLFGSLCALSFNVLGDFRIFGMTLFEFFDYISSNILLPLGGLLLALFVGWIVDRKIVDEQLTDFGERRITLKYPIYFCIRFVAPVCILLIFLFGLGLLKF